MTKKGKKLALKVNQGSKSKQRKEGVGLGEEGENGGGDLAWEGKGMGEEMRG